MNKLRYMILALATVMSLAMISCSNKEEFTPGKPDVEGCFGVYFPSQEASSKTLSFEPGDKFSLNITVAREFDEVDEDVTVPFKFSGDEVFEVSDIVFEGGASSTKFQVSFPDAELGKKYKCTIEVDDPQFVSNYRTKANYITIEVVIVSWEEIGEATYIDYSFTNTSTNEPLSVKTMVYKNSNDANVYRIDDPYRPYMEEAGQASSTPAAEYFEIRVLERNQEFIPYDGAEAVTIPVADLIHYEPIFLSFAHPTYGDAYYYHPSLLNGYEDPMTWYDNRVLSWLDEEHTQPGLMQLAPSTYFPSAGGYDPTISALIVFPGAKLTDYTMEIVPGLTEEGAVPMSVTLGEDVAEVKYAVFNGELAESQITEKVDDILAGEIDCEIIKEAGDYKITSLKETGIYTLIAVAYNASGENVNYTSTVFGFLKNGETSPVDINCGLILSDKNAPAGYTSENSLEFYIYGKDIRSLNYGLYRKKDFDEKYESVMKDLNSYSATEEEIEAVNGNGLSDVFIRLNSGMEYVFIVKASNGYEEKIIHKEIKMNGELNPLQMTYDLDMLHPANDKSDYCREWEFWCGTPESNGRYEVGPVTVSDAGKEMVEIKNDDGTTEEIEVDLLNVKGFWKPVIDEGYLYDDTMKWEYYEGAIVPLHDKVGEFKNSSGQSLSLVMLSFFSSLNGGAADGAVCGAFTDEGNIAFVDMETGQYDEFGEYWFTALGVFDSKGNYLSEMISYDEMMFIDPANLPKDEEKENEPEAVSMLKEVKLYYQSNFNYVEYKRYQLYRAIDNVFGSDKVKSFGQRAGLEIDIDRTQVDCQLQKDDSSVEKVLGHIGEPGQVSLRN